jgi:hypothetical protein
MGGPGSGRGGQQRNLDRELECVRLREQGLTLTEIGRRLGIGAQSVARALRRQGRGDLLGRRGFAAATPEGRRKVASMGSKAAHALGRAHEFTVQEAREVAKKATRKRSGGGG